MGHAGLGAPEVAEEVAAGEDLKLGLAEGYRHMLLELSVAGGMTTYADDWIFGGILGLSGTLRKYLADRGIRPRRYGPSGHRAGFGGR